jgi:hypothetical protein
MDFWCGGRVRGQPQNASNGIQDLSHWWRGFP